MLAIAAGSVTGAPVALGATVVTGTNEINEKRGGTEGDDEAGAAGALDAMKDEEAEAPVTMLCEADADVDALFEKEAFALADPTFGMEVAAAPPPLFAAVTDALAETDPIVCTIRMEPVEVGPPRMLEDAETPVAVAENASLTLDVTAADDETEPDELEPDEETPVTVAAPLTVTNWVDTMVTVCVTVDAAGPAFEEGVGTVGAAPSVVKGLSVVEGVPNWRRRRRGMTSITGMTAPVLALLGAAAVPEAPGVAEPALDVLTGALEEAALVVDAGGIAEVLAGEDEATEIGLEETDGELGGVIVTVAVAVKVPEGEALEEVREAAVGVDVSTETLPEGCVLANDSGAEVELLPAPSTPPVTPAATKRAPASVGVSQAMDVPAAFTRGRARFRSQSGLQCS